MMERRQFSLTFGGAMLVHVAILAAVVAIVRAKSPGKNSFAAAKVDLSNVQWLDGPELTASDSPALRGLVQKLAAKTRLPSANGDPLTDPASVLALPPKATPPPAEMPAKPAAEKHRPAKPAPPQQAPAKPQTAGKKEPPRPAPARPAIAETKKGPAAAELHPKAPKSAAERLVSEVPPVVIPKARIVQDAPAEGTTTEAPADRPGLPSSGQGDEDAVADYHSRIQALFEKRWQQPHGLATNPAAPPTAKVALTISRDGAVSGQKLVQSSGFSEIDESALAAAVRVQRIDPLPSALRGDSYRVIIKFELH